jgi:hypothetical protein
MYKPTPIALFTLGGVLLCWLVFACIFLFRKRPPKAPEAKRDPFVAAGDFPANVRVLSGVVSGAMEAVPSTGRRTLRKSRDRVLSVHHRLGSWIGVACRLGGAHVGQAVGLCGAAGRKPHADHGRALRLCSQSHLHGNARHARGDRVGDGALDGSGCGGGFVCS